MTAPSESSTCNRDGASGAGTTEQQTSEARHAFLTALSSTAQSSLAPLQSRASDIHNASQRIDAQQQSLETTTNKVAKEEKQYEKVAEDAGAKLKELGDVQNWAEMLERDLLVLEDMMDTVEGEEDMRRECVNGDAAKRKTSWM
ncbi:MAG: hypothetical protein Q9191_003079 [Dirinaria sp. TL-2023a]